MSYPSEPRALTTACQLLARGLYVVPVHSQTRKPLVKWGDVDRLGFPTDGPRCRDIVVGSGLPYSSWLAYWWDRWPDAGAAVLTGRSRLLVVDVDVGHNGHRSLRNLEVELPETLVMATRHGGIHIYLRVQRLVRSTAGVLGEGLDTRSHRGLAVCPPTPGYRVLIDRDIAPAPAELVTRCPSVTRDRRRGVSKSVTSRYLFEDEVTQAILAHALRRIAESGPGQRHDTVFGQSRYLFKYCLDDRCDVLLLEAACRDASPSYYRNYQRAIADAKRKETR